MKKQISIIVAGLLLLAPVAFAGEDTSDGENNLGKITFSGALEVEAGFEGLDLSDGSSENTSDIAMATVALGFSAKVKEGIEASALFLWEDGEDALVVDEAFLAYQSDLWVITAGLQYLPFGNFSSSMLSGPITMELGETSEAAIQAGYEGEGFSLAAFFFNGDAEKVSGYDLAGDPVNPEEEKIRDFGFSAVVSPTETLEIGVSYLSDLADANSEITSGAYIDRVAGISVYALFPMGSVNLSCEYLGALDDFNALDLDADGDGDGDSPSAWFVEAAFEVSETLEVAVRYETSDEVADAPESQFGISASWGIADGVSFSAEYLNGSFNDFGGGVDSRDLVTTQLAMEF